MVVEKKLKAMEIMQHQSMVVVDQGILNETHQPYKILQQFGFEYLIVRVPTRQGKIVPMPNYLGGFQDYALKACKKINRLRRYI